MTQIKPQAKKINKPFIPKGFRIATPQEQARMEQFKYNRWIKCTTLLPKMGQRVIVLTKSETNYVQFAHLNKDKKWLSGGNMIEVIAWMPIPNIPEELKILNKTN